MIAEAWAHLSVCVFVCVDSTLFTLTHMSPLPPHSSPFHPHPPSPFFPCSEARHGSSLTWPVCTGALWVALARPLSVNAGPSTCVNVYIVMWGSWRCPTPDILGKLNDAVRPHEQFSTSTLKRSAYVWCAFVHVCEVSCSLFPKLD